MNRLPPDRSFVLTELRNPRTMNLHQLSVDDCVRVINEEDQQVFKAVEAAKPAITHFIEAIEPHFLKGGRLIYIGAGTSGRLGVLDASETPPTFQIEPGRIVGIIAGGDRSLRVSSESKEDDLYGSYGALGELNLTSSDTLLGIAAGGTTPYVLGALECVKNTLQMGAAQSPLTGLLVCTPMKKPVYVDHIIVVETGPEAITGSTRMKAGTATKLVLNTISTTLMIRTGRVYENLMVDVKATNDKLKDRAARIVGTLTGLKREESFDVLDQADGYVKIAVIMHRSGLTRTEAEKLLSVCHGRLDMALKSQKV